LSSAKAVYLNQFFFLLCIQAYSDVGPNYILKKICYIDAELAGHVHELYVKL